MGTLKICFLIKIYQCLYYQLTRVKRTVIHRFNVNAGLRSFPPIEENKHRIWGEDIAWVWQYCRLLTDLIHQGGLAASSRTGFCGVQKCCLKFQADLLMSACCCSLLWSSFFSLGMAWKWFLWRQRILLQLPNVALLTSPCSLDSLWSSFGFPKIMEWIGSWLSWDSTQAVFLPLLGVTMSTLGAGAVLLTWMPSTVSLPANTMIFH